MIKSELDSSLNFINSPDGGLQIILYANVAGKVKKLDIKKDDLPKLSHLFINQINSEIIQKNDYSLVALSTADDRRSCFFEYDLALPDELKAMKEVIGNDKIEVFDFTKNNLSEINSLIIVLADKNNAITLFKKLSSIEIIGRGGFVLWKSNQRLEKFEDQLLRISPKFQFMFVNNSVILLDISTIERSYGFHEVITREANIGLDAIRNINLISNIETLEELIGDISFARKLTRVARSSPVITHNIPNNQIVDFAKKHPLTRNRMRFTTDGSQFSLDTKVSKDLFIKILNDDLLTSELTKMYYDSLAKDSIPVEGES